MTIENQQHNVSEHEDSIEAREHAVIHEARFFEPYKKELHELFVALNREEEWSDNPADMLEYMRKRWIGGEHGNSAEKDQFTEEETAAAMKVLKKMRFTGEVLPPKDAKFDQTFIVGGFMTAEMKREKFVLDAIEQGTDLGVQIWGVGQRPRAKNDGTDEELLGTEGRFAGYDVSGNPWAEHARKIISETTGNPDDDNWAFTETDVTRLALLKFKDPTLVPHRIDLDIAKVNGEPYSKYEPRDDAPHRVVTDYRFDTDDGEVILLNGAAVERNGPSRHTTASVTEEWLERHAPPKGAKVLYVTGNPHTLRTTQDTYAMLKKMNRGDIELVMAGTVEAANLPIQGFLGEVARLIDNDWKRNYQHDAEEV